MGRVVTIKPLYRSLTATGLGLMVLLGWFFVSMQTAQGAVLHDFFQTTMIQAMSVAMLLVGLFFLSFWWARRVETEYLLLAVASLVWSANNVQFILPPPDDPGLLAWYRALLEQLPIAWLNWLVFQFYVRFLPQRPRRLEMALAVYVLLATALGLPVWGDVGDTRLLATTVYTAVGISSILWMACLALRHPCPELIAMACVLILCSVAGAHDWAARAQWLDSGRVPLIPYGGLLVFGSFLYAVQRRYVGAIRAEEQMSAGLAARLAERESQLNQQHQRVLALERAQAQAGERQRLMRDMHDGLGAHLGAALMMAEQGRLGPGDQLQTLRFAVDDLRAVIDSSAAEGQYLGDVWAAVRHRWYPRLQAAGLQVRWPTLDASIDVPLKSERALDMQRWLHEALANVLKHARASRVAVTAVLTQQALRISVEDDGVGFDAAQVPRPSSRGLGNLASRAERLGARFTLVATPGYGTVLALEWMPPSATGVE